MEGASTYLQQYQVNYLPKNYLINEKGIILAKDLRDTMVTTELNKWIAR